MLWLTNRLMRMADICPSSQEAGQDDPEPDRIRIRNRHRAEQRDRKPRSWPMCHQAAEDELHHDEGDRNAYVFNRDG